LSRPFPSRHSSSPGSSVRINGKIRAREVRVIGLDGKQLGIYQLHDAIGLAKSNGVDLVEIAPNATPPVCRMVDYGKFRYEQSKKDKDAKRHQHAVKVKEVQLTCSIDPHDAEVKLHHAIDFLCEEMKVKVTLRFRGREMIHKELGFQVVGRFLQALESFGHPDAPPKLIGKGITVMLSPLPRNKRAKNPKETGEAVQMAESSTEPASAPELVHAARPAAMNPPPRKPTYPPPQVNRNASGGFVNNPFEQLDLEVGQ
jgi:translation initiation factor IF-3